MGVTFQIPHFKEMFLKQMPLIYIFSISLNKYVYSVSKGIHSAQQFYERTMFSLTSPSTGLEKKHIFIYFFKFNIFNLFFMKLKYQSIKLFLNRLIAICQSFIKKNRNNFEEDI